MAGQEHGHAIFVEHALEFSKDFLAFFHAAFPILQTCSLRAPRPVPRALFPARMSQASLPPDPCPVPRAPRQLALVRLLHSTLRVFFALVTCVRMCSELAGTLTCGARRRGMKAHSQVSRPAPSPSFPPKLPFPPPERGVS